MSVGTIGYYGFTPDRVPLIGINKPGRYFKWNHIQPSSDAGFLSQSIHNVNDALKEVVRVRDRCPSLPEYYFKKTVEYISEYPDNSIVLFAVEWNADGTYTPKGYLLAFGKSYCVHLQLVCGTGGYGSYLIESLLQYCDHVLGVNVELDALNSVLFYYQRFGFVFKNSCNEESIDIGIYNKENIENLIREAVKILVRNDINVNKCDYMNLKDGELSYICAADGFRMQRCKFAAGNPYFIDRGINLEHIGNDRLKISNPRIYDQLKALLYDRKKRLRSKTRSFSSEDQEMRS